MHVVCFRCPGYARNGWFAVSLHCTVRRRWSFDSARGRGGPCLDPNCTCRMQDIQRYEEIAREADASIERIARIFAEMGADAATMEKVCSIRSAADAEKEKYRKMTGRSI